MSRLFIFICALLAVSVARAEPSAWQGEWPQTDFSRHSVEWDSIFSGGVPKDAIPSIDAPEFAAVGSGGWLENLSPDEPVVSHGGRAYPLRILTWHEIVNDEVGGIPVAVTYCPLCNAAIVFDRRADGRVLEFGTTGKLRHSDLIMYDRQTESWWQQFTGDAIAGELTGTTLTILPARLESWSLFVKRHPDGLVLIPNNENLRQYGRNPYAFYDAPGGRPFLYRGDFPEGIAPMARVVVAETSSGREAWSLERVRAAGELQVDDLIVSWTSGQASALDSPQIADGRDVGNVTVERVQNGERHDVPYDVTFAFVFHAFYPDRPIHTE